MREKAKGALVCLFDPDSPASNGIRPGPLSTWPGQACANRPSLPDCLSCRQVHWPKFTLLKINLQTQQATTLATTTTLHLSLLLWSPLSRLEVATLYCPSRSCSIRSQADATRASSSPNGIPSEILCVGLAKLARSLPLANTRVWGQAKCLLSLNHSTRPLAPNQQPKTCQSPSRQPPTGASQSSAGFKQTGKRQTGCGAAQTCSLVALVAPLAWLSGARRIVGRMRRRPPLGSKWAPAEGSADWGSLVFGGAHWVARISSQFNGGAARVLACKTPLP